MDAGCSERRGLRGSQPNGLHTHFYGNDIPTEQNKYSGSLSPIMILWTAFQLGVDRILRGAGDLGSRYDSYKLYVARPSYKL